MFFPNFSTFTLYTPLVLRQRRIEEQNKDQEVQCFSELSNLYSWDSKFVSTVKTKRKYSWDPNFVSTSKHRRKRRSTSTFSYQLCSRRKEKKKFFKHQKGVQRTYVTVANQSTVHRTNPNRRKEIQYQRTATQITEMPQLLLRVTNHSERTLLLGDSNQR